MSSSSSSSGQQAGNLSDELKTMSLKQNTGLTAVKVKGKGPSPLSSKRLQNSKSVPIPHNFDVTQGIVYTSISKSEEDLSREPLSDDDDDDEEMVL